MKSVIFVHNYSSRTVGRPIEDGKTVESAPVLNKFKLDWFSPSQTAICWVFDAPRFKMMGFVVSGCSYKRVKFTVI